MSTALGGTTKGRSENLATPPTQPEHGRSSGRLSSAEKGAAAWGMGSWAPAEPISPYGALMGDPYCAPTMRAPTEEARINPAHLSQIARPRCAPTRRAHIARPQCALTLRAHMGDMGSTHPVWVHWFPYGAPHGGSGRKRSPRGEWSHYSLKGPREFLFRTKRRSNESPTISTSLSRFSSSGRFSLASVRESGASNRPPLSRANHETRAAQQPRPPLTSR